MLVSVKIHLPVYYVINDHWNTNVKKCDATAAAHSRCISPDKNCIYIDAKKII